MYENYVIFDLPAVNANQKSFYGKAKIIKYAETDLIELKSYQTIVCDVLDGVFFTRRWGGYSATTLRHVNSFLAYIGEDIRLTKSQWLRLDAGEPYFIDDLRSKYFKAGF